MERDRRLIGARRLIIVVALMAAVACGRTAPSERSTRAPGPARRVVSLVPAATEMLFAIGAGPQVVAVSSFDHYPPQVEKLARVGALLDPDVERIITLRPDLAIVFEGQVELREKLEQAGIPLFAYGRPRLEDIAKTMRRLGELVGRPREAGTAAGALSRELADLAGSGARDTSRPPVQRRVMLVIGRDPGTLRNIYVSGNVGFLADLLRLVAGSSAVNAFAGVNRENLQVTTEAILAAQPDVIVEVVAARPWSDAAISQEQHVWDPLGALPAVRHHDVHLLVGDEFVIPGPRVVQAAKELASVLAR